MNNAHDFLRFMMDEKLKYCRTCKGLRKKISFEQLSESAQEGFMTYKNSGKFLFCEKCNEYSMIANYEFGY